MMELASPDAAAAADLSRLNFTRHHAFIVGIDAYTKVAPLKTAVNDARRLAELLAGQHHITVHPPLLDAGRAQILELLHTTLPAKVGADDRVIFYFAGHGIAADGDDGPAGYLVPADAEPSDLKTFIPMAELQTVLDALPCRHLLLILDCCFSGAFKWSSQHRAIGTLMPKRLYDERFNRFAADAARQIITSAAYDQKALDVLQGQATGERGVVDADDGRAHSPFALALFDGLAGAADVRGDGEGDGVITATELYCHIRDQIEPATLKAGATLRQTPSFFPLKGHDKGEFMFLHPRHRLNLPPMPLRSPYMGLSSFDEADQHLFYGRDRVIKELRARADDPDCRLLVVVGPSGTGKSSVIKAGLLPVLREAGLAILPVLRPGEHPMAELTRVLSEATAQGAVLLVDQFEELVTRCADVSEREAFDQRLRALLDAHDRVARIIITVRSDFEPQLNGGALKDLWFRGRVTVPPFSLDELREVIVMPTLQEVLIFDPPELVDQIIGEVVQSPGVLPLLSYALNELYEAYVHSGRSDRALKQADYEQLGGVMGALRTKADTLYQSLATDAERDIMRKVMLRMVAVEDELAGKRVAIGELVFPSAAKAQVDHVIEQLVETRLVVRSADAIEPAHDALVRAWKTLREWIHAAGKDKLILGGQLQLATAAFAQSGDVEFLWNSNPNLPVVQRELADPRQCWFNTQEAAFVRASVRRKVRRAWLLRGITLSVIAALTGLAAWAWDERRQAVGTITEARGFTDGLMFQIISDLQKVEKTDVIRSDLLDRVGELQAKLSQFGARKDPSTRFWKSILEGDIADERKQTDTAREKYEESERIAEPLKSSLDWERNLSVSHGKLGDLALRTDETDAGVASARGWYDKALAIDQRLSSADPGNTLLQRDLYASYMRLGNLDAPSRAGNDKDRLHAARTMYESAHAVADGLLKRDPTDADALRAATASLVGQGRIAFKLAATTQDSDVEAAHAQAVLGQAVAIAEQHPDELKNHLAMQADIVAAYGLLARMHRENNRLDAARSAGTQALAIAQTQAAANPGDAAWQHFHLLGHAEMGRIALQLHEVPAARQSSTAALNIAQREAASHPDNLLWRDEQFKLWMTLGAIETEARRPQAARAAYTEALKKAATPENRQRANAQLGAISALGRRRGR